jgi:hypothetical protein
MSSREPGSILVHLYAPTAYVRSVERNKDTSSRPLLRHWFIDDVLLLRRFNYILPWCISYVKYLPTPYILKAPLVGPHHSLFALPIPPTSLLQYL